MLLLSNVILYNSIRRTLHDPKIVKPEFTDVPKMQRLTLLKSQKRAGIRMVSSCSPTGTPGFHPCLRTSRHQSVNSHLARACVGHTGTFCVLRSHCDRACRVGGSDAALGPPATSARTVARRRAALPGGGTVTGGSLACMPAAGPPRCDTDTNLSQILHKSCIVLMTCHAPVWHTLSNWDAGRPHRVPHLCSYASRPRRPQGCSSPWPQAVVWVAGNLRHGAPQAGGTMGHRLERRDRWTSMPSLIRLWPSSASGSG
jgi:hypothetical protein